MPTPHTNSAGLSVAGATAGETETGLAVRQGNGLGNSYIFVTPAQCVLHPKNIRRVYGRADVERIAGSIRRRGKLLQAMKVTPTGATVDTPGGPLPTYYVVIGNLRAAGAKLLGADCPPLQAEVVTWDEAEILLGMIDENFVRVDIDPISEALHYRRLVDELGMSLNRIGQETGQSGGYIKARLDLLQLDEPIQALIAEGKLPVDPRAVAALLSVPVPSLRVQIAQQIAEKAGRSVIAVKAACERANAALAKLEGAPVSGARGGSVPKGHELPVPAGPLQTPMVELAVLREGGGLPAGGQVVDFDALREAARQACVQCDIYTVELKRAVPEPAWHLLMAEAGFTCQNCSEFNPQDIAICQGCPAVVMFQFLLRRLINGKTAARQPTAA